MREKTTGRFARNARLQTRDIQNLSGSTCEKDFSTEGGRQIGTLGDQSADSYPEAYRIDQNLPMQLARFFWD
jgi:hypothetical protein